MLPARVFVEPLTGPERRRLPEEEARHIRARRLAPGSEIVAFDGSGRWASGTLISIQKNRVEIDVGEIHVALEPSPRISIGVSAIRLPRLSWLVEKATELSASDVTIVETARTQGERVRIAASELFRLRRLAVEACKQCGSLRAPRIEGPVAAPGFLKTKAGIRLILDPGGEPFPAELSCESVLLWAGPEGGFEEAEREAILGQGWRAVRLPGGTLRTETAVIAGLVLARQAFDRAR
jgi:16S rRNA (uracil1498-N3)-methyltransferase